MKDTENKKIRMNVRSVTGCDLYSLAADISNLDADPRTVKYLGNYIIGAPDFLSMIKWISSICAPFAREKKASANDYAFTPEDMKQLSQFCILFEKLAQGEAVRPESLELMTHFPEALKPFVEYFEAAAYLLAVKQSKTINLTNKIRECPPQLVRKSATDSLTRLQADIKQTTKPVEIQEIQKSIMHLRECLSSDQGIETYRFYMIDAHTQNAARIGQTLECYEAILNGLFMMEKEMLRLNHQIASQRSTSASPSNSRA